MSEQQPTQKKKTNPHLVYLGIISIMGIYIAFNSNLFDLVIGHDGFYGIKINP